MTEITKKNTTARGVIKLISKQEASIIAHEYIDGVILQESCTGYMSPTSSYPQSWKFEIYHRNSDKDTFLTTIEVTRAGIVANWNKTHLGEESEE